MALFLSYSIYSCTLFVFYVVAYCFLISCPDLAPPPPIFPWSFPECFIQQQDSLDILREGQEAGGEGTTEQLQNFELGKYQQHLKQAEMAETFRQLLKDLNGTTVEVLNVASSRQRRERESSRQEANDPSGSMNLFIFLLLCGKTFWNIFCLTLNAHMCFN